MPQLKYWDGSTWVNVAGAALVPLVTSLPAVPWDGQEVFYVADATNGVIWHLRYRVAASGSYKWECVGGSPLIHQIDTDEGGNSTTYTDFATVGPQVTAPRAGDYLRSYGALSYQTVATVNNWYTPKIGAVTPKYPDGALASSRGTSNVLVHDRDRRLDGLAGAAVLHMRFTMDAANAGSFRNRWLTAMPVRVG